jgi:hypothetical protein
MRKRTELNAADKLYIETHYNTPTHLLASELNLKDAQIDNYKKEVVKNNPDVASKAKVIQESLTHGQKNMLHQMMSSPKVPNVTIMTPAAAERSDELVKNHTKYINETTIHKIK